MVAWEARDATDDSLQLKNAVARSLEDEAADIGAKALRKLAVCKCSAERALKIDGVIGLTPVN